MAFTRVVPSRKPSKRTRPNDDIREKAPIPRFNRRECNLPRRSNARTKLYPDEQKSQQRQQQKLSELRKHFRSILGHRSTRGAFRTHGRVPPASQDR